MSPTGGSTPERRERKRTQQSSEPAAAAAAVSIALVLASRDLLTEILLRVGSPTWLARATLVSKRWLRAASDPSFLDRFRALHPPRILGLSALGGHHYRRLLPVPQPPELAAAIRIAGHAIGRVDQDDRCHDYRNGRLLIEATHIRSRLRYVVRSLLNQSSLRMLPPPPPLGSATEEEGLFYSDRMFLMEDDGRDGTSCLFLSMACNTATVRSDFSILRSGVWSAQQSAVRDIQQEPYHTVLGHKLLSGGKLYMLTTVGCILVLDLAMATFSAIELPDGAKDCASIKFSRAKSSQVYLICATGFQLCVWRDEGVGQWVLMDTLSVCEACAHLNVRKWVCDDEDSSPVSIVGVGDNAEFVILELVASGIICCMQLSNRVVEKVTEGVLRKRDMYLRPITMIWPPFLPVPPQDLQLE